MLQESSILRLFDDDIFGYFFQQDNASYHHAQTTVHQLPGMSPIENLWSILQKKMAKQCHNSATAINRVVKSYIGRSVSKFNCVDAQHINAVMRINKNL